LNFDFEDLSAEELKKPILFKKATVEKIAKPKKLPRQGNKNHPFRSGFSKKPKKSAV
jgi:hypothetical protein